MSAKYRELFNMHGWYQRYGDVLRSAVMIYYWFEKIYILALILVHFPVSNRLTIV